MGKKNRPPTQLPAPGPGAVPPDPEPSAQVLDTAPETPDTSAPDTAPEPDTESAVAYEGDPEALERMRKLNVAEPPSASEPPSSVPSIRCRVNWHFTGFREEELREGDEVATTEAEAAPFLGGVLSRLEDPE